MIKKMLEKMIEEIKDKEYQYTFDELGEALLFFAIIYRRENLHKIEPIYFELEDLRDMYTELIRIRGDEDYSPEHWNMLAKAIVEPAYIFELVDENCPYMLIFWDFDFLYVVEYGPEIFSRFANSPEGQHYRFIACNKDSEPESGSIKCQLDEEW